MSDPSGTFSSTPRTQVASDPALGLDASLLERRCKLTVLNGEQAGRVVEIDKPKFSVGKDDAADLALTDPTVSREHFVIEQAGAGAFVIRDQKSTNGTWIDQFRIREAYLRPGTVLRAGEVQIRFEPLFRQMEVKPSVAETFGSLVGRSVRMRQIFALLERVAKTEATVVLLGETGSGKSAVARAIHDHSARKDKPFVTVDCGAIAENLIESELFGHEKGAFTGAVAARRGALEQAQNGTLFIDELVDLPLHLQPKLLRVLEEREVRRVGANTAINLDVRIIAASRKDLWREVEAGRFREDLYFRLAVFTIPLPPLRERRDDIPALVESFAASIPGGNKLIERLKREGYGQLLEHPFYGNVRELRNLVERAVYLDGDPFAPIGAAGGHDSGAGPLSTEGAPIAPPPSALPSMPRTPAPMPVDPQASDALLPVAPVAAPAPSAPSLQPGDARGLNADYELPFKEAKEQLLDQFEAEYVRRLVEREPTSASAMARAAGIDRKHLYNLAKKHDIDLKNKS
jgi:DNA-binding NtrC family response regulator